MLGQCEWPDALGVYQRVLACVALWQVLLPGQQRVTTHLDVHKKLKDINLDGLAHNLIPPTEATDRLASKKLALTKKQVVKPFVFVELKDFLPNTYKQVGGEELKLAQWGPAFDRWAFLPQQFVAWLVARCFRYALAAAADGQWSYTASMCHKDHVLQAVGYACNAQSV